MRGALIIVLCPFILTGCENGDAGAKASAPPAKVDRVVKEVDLNAVTLTEETEKRLGIEVQPVTLQPTAETRVIAGEVIVPPGMTIDVTAPVAGTLADTGTDAPRPGMRVSKGQPLLRLVPLLPSDRDLRSDAQRDLATASAALEAAEKKVARAEQVFRDGSGSRRSLEEAQAEAATSRATFDAAKERLAVVNRSPISGANELVVSAPIDGVVDAVQVAPGQTVAASAKLLQVVRVDRLWVKVPVYAGEVRTLDVSRGADIVPLGEPAEASGVHAAQVMAPPSADPSASAVDMIFELPAPRGSRTAPAFQPGERVLVRLAARSQATAPVIAEGALLHDIHGGVWVYERTAPRVYVRRRVEVRDIVAGRAVLSRGPVPGATIVTVGAAELYGIEFGNGT